MVSFVDLPSQVWNHYVARYLSTEEIGDLRLSCRFFAKTIAHRNLKAVCCRAISRNNIAVVKFAVRSGFNEVWWCLQFTASIIGDHLILFDFFVDLKHLFDVKELQTLGFLAAKYNNRLILQRVVTLAEQRVSKDRFWEIDSRVHLGLIAGNCHETWRDFADKGPLKWHWLQLFKQYGRISETHFKQWIDVFIEHTTKQTHHADTQTSAIFQAIKCSIRSNLPGILIWLWKKGQTEEKISVHLEKIGAFATDTSSEIVACLLTHTKEYEEQAVYDRAHGDFVKLNKLKVDGESINKAIEVCLNRTNEIKDPGALALLYSYQHRVEKRKRAEAEEAPSMKKNKTD